MMKEYRADNIYFIGDTHDLDFAGILEHYDLKDFILIHVGDTGTGFHHKDIDKARIGFLHNYCEKNNGRIFLIRGNHDDPQFFVDNSEFNTELVTFLADYTYLKINDLVCLFVGGAISIDRTHRIEGRDYWSNEPFVLIDDYKSLRPCDVLVTHSSPISCHPNDGFAKIGGWMKQDPELKELLKIERNNIEQLYNHVNCRQLYYGHFHAKHSEYFNGCWHRCLDINEIFDATYEFRSSSSVSNLA